MRIFCYSVSFLFAVVCGYIDATVYRKYGVPMQFGFLAFVCGGISSMFFMGASKRIIPPDEANAKLIAAAPELLDALANLIRHHDQDNPYCESFNKSWYSARLAIYKAEGKQ